MTNRPPGVNHPLTPGKRQRVVENDEYAAFMRRVIRTAGRRIGRGDIEGLGDLAALSAELDAAIAAAVNGLRAGYGYSWAEIGARFGVSRQAAHQRWAGDDR